MQTRFLKNLMRLGIKLKYFFEILLKWPFHKYEGIYFFIASRKDLNFLKLKLQFKENPIKYVKFLDNNYRLINKSKQ